MNFGWFDFPKDWPRFYKRLTRKEHNRESVNGNCTFVADLYRQFLGKGENQYGFYVGDAPHPHWHKRQRRIRHGWLKVEGPNGRFIVDPSRWCFYNGDVPLLAIADENCEDYDLGMNRLKAALFAPYREKIPVFDGRPAACDQPDLLRIFEGKVSVKRLFWIANKPPGDQMFESEAQRIRIFTWLEQNDHGALIPIDNRVR